MFHFREADEQLVLPSFHAASIIIYPVHVYAKRFNVKIVPDRNNIYELKENNGDCKKNIVEIVMLENTIG